LLDADVYTPEAARRELRAANALDLIRGCSWKWMGQAPFRNKMGLPFKCPKPKMWKSGLITKTLIGKRGILELVNLLVDSRRAFVRNCWRSTYSPTENGIRGRLRAGAHSRFVNKGCCDDPSRRTRRPLGALNQIVLVRLMRQATCGCLLFAGGSVSHASASAARPVHAARWRSVTGCLRAALGDRTGAAADQAFYVASALRADFEGILGHFLSPLKPDIANVALIFIGRHRLTPVFFSAFPVYGAGLRLRRALRSAVMPRSRNFTQSSPGNPRRNRKRNGSQRSAMKAFVIILRRLREGELSGRFLG